MNILSAMSIIFLDVNAIHLATVLIFGIFCPQGLENAQQSGNTSKQTASAGARSFPKCQHIRNVPNCQV